MKTKVLQLNQQDLEAAQMHAAVNEVFNKEGDRLFNFIRSRVPTNEDAEDIFQEVFFQLSDAYLVAKDIRNGGAWVFRVARNKIIDFFKTHAASLEPINVEHLDSRFKGVQVATRDDFNQIIKENKYYKCNTLDLIEKMEH